MSSRLARNILIVMVAAMLLLGSFSGGVLVGWILPKSSAAAAAAADLNSPQPATGTPAGSSAGDVSFAPFWEAWDLVHSLYVDQPVNDNELMRGAIRGMLDALGDPHTSYMSPEEYTQANSSLEGEYDGIGAVVDITGTAPSTRSLDELRERLANSGRYGKLPTFNYLGKLL